MIMIMTMICSKCGYEWISRKDSGEPKECPHCKSRKWKGDKK